MRLRQHCMQVSQLTVLRGTLWNCNGPPGLCWILQWRLQSQCSSIGQHFGQHFASEANSEDSLRSATGWLMVNRDGCLKIWIVPRDSKGDRPPFYSSVLSSDTLAPFWTATWQSPLALAAVRRHDRLKCFLKGHSVLVTSVHPALYSKIVYFQ